MFAIVQWWPREPGAASVDGRDPEDRRPGSSRSVGARLAERDAWETIGVTGDSIGAAHARRPFP
ncbi:hypothetical protein MMAD_31320 [Mycolicibacterium madagascariense]|uniref:Uncharacterized protein n=1 Tax=Mycolicibacterium madagascariense TaxID=212765 RepID=A0A7I7XI01_9MYCO|nr:hypothetical protein MMAD_31320 [Mycolicibacterium madagascariense]